MGTAIVAKSLQQIYPEIYLDPRYILRRNCEQAFVDAKLNK